MIKSQSFWLVLKQLFIDDIGVINTTFSNADFDFERFCWELLLVDFSDRQGECSVILGGINMNRDL
ncbi:hypothetical protein C6H68_15485 [Photorhabdus luminescens]|nr:hypothetical protein C6H68_15485 [Photorhabdus luminescens]